MDNYSKVISMKKEITPLKTPLRPQCFDFPNEDFPKRPVFVPLPDVVIMVPVRHYGGPDRTIAYRPVPLCDKGSKRS